MLLKSSLVGFFVWRAIVGADADGRRPGAAQRRARGRRRRGHRADAQRRPGRAGRWPSRTTRCSGAGPASRPRMTKQEVKQEHKQSEGDPMLKGAIRSRQLAAARNRMMADVPDRRRGAGQPHPRRGRAALRPGARAPRGWSPGAPAWSPPGSASWPTTHRVPLVARHPARAGAALRAARSARRSRRSSSRRSPRCSRSCISLRANGHAAGRHRTPRTGEPLPGVPAPAAACDGARRLLRSGRRRPIEPSSQDGSAVQHHGRRPPTLTASTPPEAAERCTVAQTQPGSNTRPTGRAAVGVPVGIVGIVVMLVVPLPAVLLDLLIAFNITARPAGAAHRDVRAPAAGLLRVPGDDPGRDPVPARPERQRHPAGPARRVRRQGDRHLRPLRRRRLADRRHRSSSRSSSSSSSSSSPTVPVASPRSGRGSPSTRCPASRWRSTPT